MKRGNEFLLACIRLWGRDDELAQKAVRDLADTAPEDVLYSVAHDSHLAPVAYHVLRQHNLLNLIPDHLTDKLRTFYHFTAARNAVFFRNLQTLLEGAEQRGFDVMLLKGLSLIAAGYYPDKGLRFLSDMDVLIRREDIRAADELLKELGWEAPVREPLEKQLKSHHHLDTVLTPQGTPVEVHFLISRLRIDLDLDLWWRRSKPLPQLSPAAYMPSPEDQLIHLALNTSMHHPDRLIQMHLKFMADLVALMHGVGKMLDWDYVFKTAEDSDIEVAVIHPLVIANELLEQPWLGVMLQNHGALDRVHLDFLQRITDDIREGRPISEVSWMVVHLGEASGRGNKLRVLLRMIFPSWAEMSEIYPQWAGSRWFFLAYVQRIGRLILTFNLRNFLTAYRAGSILREKPRLRRGRKSPPSDR